MEKVGNKARKSLSSQHRAEAEPNVNFVTRFIINIDKNTQYLIINIPKRNGAMNIKGKMKIENFEVLNLM